MALQPPRSTARGPLGEGQDPRDRAEADRQNRPRTEQLADACAKAEEDLESLRARYEMHFLGIERREPARERQEMKRRVAKLKGEFTRNAGLRFRLETLHARFISYERLWLRSAREKEEGTYRRDLLRARRRTQGASDGTAGGNASEQPRAGVAHQAAPNAKVPAAPSGSATGVATPPPVVLPAAFSEAQVRELLAAYVAAKERCNEDVSRISYEALARSVAKQVPELMARYQAKAVEFKVIVRDGRAILKAIPRI
ncbi:MAG TPA: MXAN_5187 C-terminal domain-containing protein [Anaeromyxobacteraceae bacterium]|nr:MXAN_5187 C-terminal domain-containing protein [Anaeromyxobacteraceae bacterium]